MLAWRSLGAGADSRRVRDRIAGGAPSPATTCALADVNADGIADLVVARTPPGLTTLLGNGTGRGDGGFRSRDDARVRRWLRVRARVVDVNGDSALDAFRDRQHSERGVIPGSVTDSGAFATPSAVASVGGNARAGDGATATARRTCTRRAARGVALLHAASGKRRVVRARGRRERRHAAPRRARRRR